MAVMLRLGFAPSWTDETEWIDRPDHSASELAGNLADLQRVNRWLGGSWLTLRAVERLSADLPPWTPLRVLDVATGGADIAATVADWAERRGLAAWVVATDLSPEILRLAAGGTWLARETGGAGGRTPPDLAFAAADGRRLPFRDGAFDIVISSLAIHHLRPPDAALMLKEMRRVASHGVVVNDLVRSWVGYCGAWLFGRLLTRNPLTRHDGPLSFRRAYTEGELRVLLAAAGLAPIWQAGIPGYRMAIAATPVAHRRSFP